MRPRLRNEPQNKEPENNMRSDPMQQILGMLAQQQTMIQALREEIREVKEKQNEDRTQPEGNEEEENTEVNSERELPENNEQSQTLESNPEIPMFELEKKPISSIGCQNSLSTSPRHSRECLILQLLRIG